jgi:hypothetical protein
MQVAHTVIDDADLFHQTIQRGGEFETNGRVCIVVCSASADGS